MNLNLHSTSADSNLGSGFGYSFTFNILPNNHLLSLYFYLPKMKTEDSKFKIRHYFSWKREEQISNRSMFNLKNTKPSLLLKQKILSNVGNRCFHASQKNCTFSSIMSCSWDSPTNFEFLIMFST